jgi:lysophospholipase L1-like esterase
MSRSAWFGIALALLACSSDDSSGAGTGGKGGGGGTAGSGASGGSGGNAGSGNAAGSGATGGGSAGTGGGSAGTGGAPATPEVVFVGRTDKSEAGVVKVQWSGSGILFRFNGTDASVTLDDSAQFFSVFVDGQEQPRLATSGGQQSYPVATGLVAGDHEVRLYRRTEAFFGDTRYVGVDLGGGTLLAPPAPAAHHIELIGDSISCGYGDEGADQNCSFSADTENHTITYGAIAARNLNADLITVAWSGKGVIHNYGGDLVEPMPELYDRTLPTDAASSWDFSSWQADVVVLNLGTNDFSTDADPTHDEFVPAYTNFLAHIRGKYPSAEILCLYPTLLGGTDLSTATAYIDEAVSARVTAGDAKVVAWAMNVTSDGWGCDWHPSANTHAAMGSALTQELKALLGW